MRWTLTVKILVDLMLVSLGFAVALVISFAGKPPSAYWQAYWNLVPWISASAFILLYFYGLYGYIRRRWEEILSALICAAGILFLATISFCFLFHQFAFPRFTYFLAALIQLVFLIAWRRFVWSWSLKRLGPLYIVVVGSADSARDRARQLLHEAAVFYRVAGVVIDKSDLPSFNEPHLPVLGHFGEMDRVLEGAGINSVLFCSGIPVDQRCSMLAEAFSRGLSVFVVPERYEILVSQAHMEHLDGIPVFRLTDFTRLPAGTWKRAMDVMLVILFGIPAMLLVSLAAIAIKLESPSGPVFYLQERVGQGGKTFNLLKLRTMFPDAEIDTGPVLSHSDDQRVTRVGKLLRWSRIDELPQLWNVLVGEMSFVGPRPERPFFVEEFRKNVPGYDDRHRLRVGITGLAQIEGKYNSTPADKLRFDLLYAQSASPLKDLYILLHTIKIMLIRAK